MEEGKGKEREGEVSSIFPPNLSNFGEIMVIIEKGKMDPSLSFPFLPPIFYPNKRFCPPPFLFSSFPSISSYPNKVLILFFSLNEFENYCRSLRTIFFMVPKVN